MHPYIHVTYKTLLTAKELTNSQFQIDPRGNNKAFFFSSPFFWQLHSKNLNIILLCGVSKVFTEKMYFMYRKISGEQISAQ